MKGLPSYSPPPGGAAWTGAEGYPLLYLAWGERRYGRTPLNPIRRNDWIYVAPLSGSPTITLNGVSMVLKTGELMIMAPGSVSGYRDSVRRTCRIQTWVWKAPPHYPHLRPNPEEGRVYPLSDDQMSEIAEIHGRCREEVQNPDTYTRESLGILRARLDLCLARGPSGRASSAPPAHRLLLALRWLEEHLENHAPSAGLCRYLQVSPATLRRLFVNALGHGPREEALRMRLEAACRLIHEEKWSVKAAAYHLGYRHPNDLSRLLARRSNPQAAGSSL